MQGQITVKNDWNNINDLNIVDANGTTLSFDVVVGDTIKLYDIAENDNSVLIFQGVLPLGDTTIGCINAIGNVIIGVTEDIFIKAAKVDRDIVVEIVKGA